MSKTRFLTLAVAALILLNVGILAFFLSGKRPPHRDDGPQKTVVERLHFDAQQVAEYDNLIAQHQSGIRKMEVEIFVAKQQLYSLLQGDDFSKKDSLIARIGQAQEDIEQIHFSHFSDIKNLCRAEQIADFNALAGELARYFSPPDMGKKRNEKPRNQ